MKRDPNEPLHHPRARLYSEVHEMDGSKREWGMIILFATAFFTLGCLVTLITLTVPHHG